MVAIPNGTVPTAGTFTLTGDLNWGASFGLISQYYKSASSNISTAGVIRLAHSDSIGYRNNANGANLLLTVNSSDQLLWNGAAIPTGTIVNSITGTANEVIASSATGAVTLSTPQPIGTGSTVTFGQLSVGNSSSLPGVITTLSTSSVGGEVVFPAKDATGNVALVAPATVSATYGLILPTIQGTSGQVMKNNGSGQLSWDTPLYTGVTSITGTANQIIASASTGAVTLSAPQDLAITSEPNFAGLFFRNSVPHDILIVPPNGIFADYSLQLPNNVGATGYVLTTTVGGSTGILSWAPPSTGTVTSVAMTVPTFLSISGSPVTTSGTLAVSLSGTALPVLNGGTGVTTSTGSGNNVLSTTPTLVTPVLGAATATSITFSPTTSGIVGTTTNDNAGAGTVGQYVSATGSGTVAATSNYADGASISLTAGDWDVTTQVFSVATGGAAVSAIVAGISVTSGNSGTGLADGDNRISSPGPTSSANTSAIVASYRMSLSGTTTVYCKVQAFYASTAPTYSCRISARRVR